MTFATIFEIVYKWRRRSFIFYTRDNGKSVNKYTTKQILTNK